MAKKIEGYIMPGQPTRHRRLGLHWVSAALILWSLRKHLTPKLVI